MVFAYWPCLVSAPLKMAHAAGAQATVREVVHEWFEQQLIETVMSAQALKSTGKWSLQELESLWSESALNYCHDH